MVDKYTKGAAYKRLKKTLDSFMGRMHYVKKGTGEDLIIRKTSVPVKHKDKRKEAIELLIQDWESNGVKGYKKVTMTLKKLMTALQAKDDGKGFLADYEVPLKEQAHKIVDQILNEDANFGVNNFQSTLRSKVNKQKKSNIIAAWIGAL